ncbi:TIGR03087 family PEP-CTERM/XrtA system glycosyltransferase [Altererythrobacter confluentis]|uniref:TIGR03087 family PEP-CTERM/XrtA system glycosyltransferase n=1 Tax=Allopontixanthobacter confluentis TaxID=1849021 RepID=A0A6L7GDU4_9SPHN|nr:TIGR03087 family PEP-CTERM/XrtA system glycosyltransferase [Allopontixanthobacter confluentis]MXP14252.1 TIGR03087 family PEP-CTERM/XrtA system glycosyltransferase [Allopontixanthobacter confluentis]
MGDILFLAHRIPYPPDRGDKIRSHHLLQALQQLAPVHVGCFADTDSDLQHENRLREGVASHILVRRTKSMVRAGIEAIMSAKAVSVTAFAHSAMREWVANTLTDHEIDTIFVFSGQMGQYIPADFAGRVVVDLCDVDSAKFEAYAEKGRSPRRWVDAREGRVLATEEQRLALRAERILLVSDAEAQLFRARIGPHAGGAVTALRNGIDAGQFNPQSALPHADLVSAKGPHLVFTGQMDYAPNIAAAERVIDHILPEIRKIHGDAQFHVVGRAPVSRLLARDGTGGVRIWGEVPDVRPFLAAADLVVAPLEIARGIQNKVLEAMAMARPVLLTPEAATGIDATSGTHFAVEAGHHALVERALALLGNGPLALRMAAAARRYVVENQSWDAMLAPLASIIGKDTENTRRDVA